MRYYLETSAIRSLGSKIINYVSDSTYTSYLALFELVSGITASEYGRRKTLISILINSGIQIDYDSYDLKKYKCVNESCEDIDGIILRKMVDAVIDSRSYSELSGIRIPINDDSFDIVDFRNFDKQIRDLIFESVSKTIREFSENEDKKRIKNYFQVEGGQSSYAKSIAEICTMNLIIFASRAERNSSRYLEACGQYDGSFDMFYFCLCYRMLEAQLKGTAFQKNDIFDMMHLIFVKQSDTIVADDKIYKQLCKECNISRVLSTQEFIQEVKEKI